MNCAKCWMPILYGVASYGGPHCMCHTKPNYDHNALADLLKERDQLRAKIGRLERKLAAPQPSDDVAMDAARYRWLRDRMRVRKMQAMDGSARPALVMRVGFGFLDITTDPYSGWLDIRSFDEQREKLDAAIDAAMGST